MSDRTESHTAGDVPLSSSPAHVLAVSALDLDADLANAPAALRDHLLPLTLDQLRTLLIVHQTGSALAAARRLGREQSSVQKQLATLNNHFEALTGEALVVKRKRGESFDVTQTGVSVVEWAQECLAQGIKVVRGARQRRGQELTIGTTEFALNYLVRVFSRLGPRLAAVNVQPRLVHVRTRSFFEVLSKGHVDILLGGMVASPGPASVAEDFDMLEFSRDSLSLLTNLPRTQLPDETVISPTRLSQLPLVLPTSGIILEFVRRWYGEKYGNRLHIAAQIDDIYYGLALLRLHLVTGAMLTITGVGRRVVAGELVPNADTFRQLPLGPGFAPELQLVTGMLVRKGERQRYAADHPLNIVWTVFEGSVDDLRAEAPGTYGGSGEHEQ